MALWNNFPYSNTHELNLDWMIQQLKDVVKAMEDYAGQVTASAYASAAPEVELRGNLIDGMEFVFGIPEGPAGPAGAQGPAGPEGPEGPQGEAGAGLQILDTYATLSALQSAHPTGNAGDAYLIGTSPNFEMYIWSTGTNAWVDAGPLTAPSPATNAPLMDGTASVGTSQAYAREDHVHPVDTSRQAKLISGQNIRTINGTSLLAPGNLLLQAPLVSGIDIKTLNNNSLLGSGNLAVQPTLVSGTNLKTINNASLLGSGNVAVQPTLVSGTNIKTINNASILDSGDLELQPALESGVNIKTINGASLLGSGNMTVGAGLVGIDTQNVIASSVDVKSGSPYTATEDCWIIANTARGGWIIDGVTITTGSTTFKPIIPLKAGQTIETESNTTTLITVYGIMI